MSSPTQAAPLIGCPLSARSRAEIGERQEPYGAIVVMETILPALMGSIDSAEGGGGV